MNIGDEVSIILGGEKANGVVSGVDRDNVIIKVGNKFVSISVNKRAEEPDYKNIKAIQVDEDGRERLYG